MTGSDLLKDIFGVKTDIKEMHWRWVDSKRIAQAPV